MAAEDARRRQLETELSDCVLGASWFWCVAGVAAAIPLGVRKKSYWPVVWLGLGGARCGGRAPGACAALSATPRAGSGERQQLPQLAAGGACPPSTARHSPWRPTRATARRHAAGPDAGLGQVQGAAGSARALRGRRRGLWPAGHQRPGVGGGGATAACRGGGAAAARVAAAVVHARWCAHAACCGPPCESDPTLREAAIGCWGLQRSIGREHGACKGRGAAGTGQESTAGHQSSRALHTRALRPPGNRLRGAVVKGPTPARRRVP